VFSITTPLIAQTHIGQAFTGLAAYSLSRKMTNQKERKKHLSIAKGAFDYFNDVVKKGSMNAYPIYTLLIAERSPSKAAYDSAIRVCSRSGLLNFEAMANESAGLFFLDQGDHYWGKFYLERALGLYKDWGATGKLHALEAKHSDLLEDNADEIGAATGHVRNSSRYGRNKYRASLRNLTKKFLLRSLELSMPTLTRRVTVDGSLRDLKRVGLLD
jgi:hypothetical protein